MDRLYAPGLGSALRAVIILIMTVGPVSCSRGRGPSAEMTASPGGYRLSGSPDDTVLVFDEHSAGLRHDPVVHDLVIGADRTATTGDPSLRICDPTQVRLSDAEVQELLHYILDEQEFRKFNPRQVDSTRRVIGTDGRARHLVDDAGSPRLIVRVGGERVAARYDAPEFFARLYPEIPPLAHFSAIVARLRSVIWEVNAGGRERVQEEVARANVELAREHPEARALGPESLEWACRRGGELSLRFLRSEPLPGDSVRYTTVEILHRRFHRTRIDVQVETTRQSHFVR